MHINKKQVLSYAVMPQIFPRFKELFASGFHWLVALVAYIYYSVRLLPAGHPYLNPENKGKFGLRHVIAAAAGNLTFDRRHIDQILIFGIVMAGIVLLFGQVILLAFGLVFSQAQATGIFVTQFPESDNAFMLLDYVFGIPGFYGSCALGTPTEVGIAPCAGIPAFGDDVVFGFHAGLHSLFEFYSWALLFVGILIFMYFVVIIVAETASTGVPFGARFNTAWAPIRLLVAIGLLVPIAYGLNSGQYLTLAIAKLGSGLATNAWYGYNDVIVSVGYDNPNPSGIDAAGQGGNAALLPRPNLPDVSPFITAMQLIKTCQYAYHKRYGRDGSSVADPDEGTSMVYERIRPWLVKPGVAPIPLMNEAADEYLDLSGGTVMNLNTVYQPALEFFDYGDVVITFGAPAPYSVATPDPDATPDDDDDDTGAVIREIVPYCGEVTVPTTTAAEICTGAETGCFGDDISGAADNLAGAWYVQHLYFTRVLMAFSDAVAAAHAARYGELQDIGLEHIYRPCSITQGQLFGGLPAGWDGIVNQRDHNFIPGEDGCDQPPSLAHTQSIISRFEGQMWSAISDAHTHLLTTEGLYGLDTANKGDDPILNRGWAAAGMWYNSLAAVIGREYDAVTNIPHLSKFPLVMEEVMRLKSGGEAINVSGAEVYNPEIGDDQSLVGAMGDKDLDIAKLLYNVFKDYTGNALSLSNISVLADKNVLTSAMHGMFGTRSLMSIREEENREVHPMAQLIAIGKDLVNSTMTNVLASTGFAIAGGIYEVSGAASSAGASQALSGALSSIALVGLTAGFILFYVLPFMPFLYFFFAVGTWIKTIFEAMVGVPLWALAHIRIDSEGLPGDAASNGYFLLLEIFVRPVMCVFGLIASFVIFGAVISVVHEIFDLVVDNAMGFDDDNLNVDLGVYTLVLENKRGIIDEFFFTIIYVIMVYVMGLSCFKLIDMIPNSILRWAGAGVKSFGDTYQDPAEGLTQYAAIGGYVVGERAIGAVGKMGQATGQGLGAAGTRLPEMPMFQGEMRMAAARRAAANRGPGGGTPPSTP